MIVSRSEREGVDVEYDFGQVAVGEPLIDGKANCGNLSAAVGVYAVEAGLVQVPDGEPVVRMLNLNTGKRVDCRLQVDGGHARVHGDYAIAGVAGTGAPIRLDFLEPGGAGTGALLPTGAPVDMLELPDGTSIAASIVDATNLCVFVRAADMGLAGTELPPDIRSKVAVIARLEAIRAAAAVKAGIAATVQEAGRLSRTTPKIAMVTVAADAPTLSGDRLHAADCDILVRMISMGLPHLAIPLTGAMCVGVAAQIAGTLVQECARPNTGSDMFRVGHSSGVLPVSAVVERRAVGWFAERVPPWTRCWRRSEPGRMTPSSGCPLGLCRDGGTSIAPLHRPRQVRYRILSAPRSASRRYDGGGVCRAGNMIVFSPIIG
jgi:2-methylaconitate cis-trans-isomerase PrpF